jgi:hypothetical protein
VFTDLQHLRLGASEKDSKTRRHVQNQEEPTRATPLVTFIDASITLRHARMHAKTKRDEKNTCGGCLVRRR